MKGNSLINIKIPLILLLLVCGFTAISQQPAQAQNPYPGPATSTYTTATSASAPYPGPATATSRTSTQVQPTSSVSPEVTEGPISTPSATTTTTLVPLPAITLIFPALTNTPTATETSVSNLPTDVSETSNKTGLPGLSPRIKLLAVIIIALWVILAGFVIIFIRQVR
jgi:hypothetical protein